jgi:hypothetical protein
MFMYLFAKILFTLKKKPQRLSRVSRTDQLHVNLKLTHGNHSFYRQTTTDP